MKNAEGAPALTARQVTFVSSMLAGISIKQSAMQAGVSERTAHTWLALSQVKAALASGTEALLSSARERIDLLSLQAVDTLAALMNDPETPATVRATCARALAARILDVKPVEAETDVRPGIDFSQFSAEDLDIIYPIFEKYTQEKKQA